MNPAAPSVSIILCTFERTTDLLATLESIRRTQLPGGMTGELIVVDSSRTEETRRALREQVAPMPHLPLRILHEPRRGKAHALNTGIAAARGEILLFTDDDVRVPAGWIEAMTHPILAGEADAVAGGIRLAAESCLPWMQLFHRAWMASTEVLNPKEPETLIGANMAFARRVLERVPLFDPELGAGSVLGGCDETLFSYQLREAGYRLVSVFDVSVEHHFDPSRLELAPLLERAKIEGHSAAYIAHHWSHESVVAPYLELITLRLKRWIKGWWLRSSQTSPAGTSPWELSNRLRSHFIRQYLCERSRPRNYLKRGLIKQR